MLRSPQAERDLDDIWDYVATHDPLAADRLIDRLAEKFDRLAEYPRLGQAHPDLGGMLRSFTVARYILFYKPRLDGIEVIRVLHGARDIPGLLAED